MPNWKPTASIETLKARAAIMARVRQFFAERGILEVETALLSRYSVTDRYMRSFAVKGFMDDGDSREGYLQTSPEYAMKRLLAAGSGSIYQICKSFRQDEIGRRHNPEFTMLEWYIEGFDYHQLMKQLFDFIEFLSVNCDFSVTMSKMTYDEVFARFLQINPFTIKDSDLAELATQKLGDLPQGLERDDYLALLFEGCIEPSLGKKAGNKTGKDHGHQSEVCFIYDYPASQSALARLNPENPDVACRFEVYWQGVELANGFYELTDPKEQRQRFEADNQWRKANDLPEMSIDENFMAALEHGLPKCSGVALGLDRLMMILLQKNDLRDVLSFPSDRA